MDNDTPKYVRIKNYILDSIKSGKFAPGSKIPTEKEIAEMFSVSRVTANKALKELSVAGVLDSTRGRGTFVTSASPASTEASAFVKAVKFSLEDNARVHQVLSFRIIPGPEELLKKGRFASDADFYEIVLANKRPWSSDEEESLDYIYIPVELTGGMNILPTLDYLSAHFVFDYLKAKINVTPKFIKIYVNTPLHPFLEGACQLLGNPPHMQIWDEDIFDENMQLLSTVYTVCPNDLRNVPLFTFAL